MGNGTSATDRVLDLKHKGFKDLDAELKHQDLISTLTRPEKLLLQQNKLSALGVKSLDAFVRNALVVEHLREVTLHHNRLKAIPEAMCLLINVQRLRLDHNALEEVPLALAARMYQLRELHLNDNALRELPWNLNNLRRLKILYLHHNALTYLPNTIAELELSELSYHDNPLGDRSVIDVPSVEAALDTILNQRIPPAYKAQVRAVLQLDGKDGKPKTADELLFETLLKSDELSKPFRSFLEREYAHENLLFYERCERYHLDYNSEVPIHSLALLAEAEEILREFVDDGGKHLVNLPSPVVAQLKAGRLAKTLDQNSFELARAHIFRLMFTDLFTRFRHTEDAQKVISRGRKVVAKWLKAGGVEVTETMSTSSRSH